MSAFLIGLCSALCVLGGGLLGMGLQRVMQQHHLSKEMQDLVKLSAGTIATLTALVLGLLVSSAKSAFDNVNTGIVQGSAKIIFLDRALARYGPETANAREELKKSVAVGLDTIWPSEKTGDSVMTSFEKVNGMEVLQDELSKISPTTPAQGLWLNQARQLASDLGQTRWMLIEESHAQLPTPLLVILIFWLTLLFVSFGLFAPRSRMAIIVLAAGAGAISAAIFLVFELTTPFDGMIKVSSAPMRSAYEHLGR